MNNPLPLYRVSDMPPPLTVRVRLVWAGWAGEGARIRCPRTGRERWVAWEKGRVRDLPPAGSPRDQAEPDLWGPLNPDLWKMPLPEPVVQATAEGRMWAGRQSFGAVEAALAAREMEADREAARAQARGIAGDDPSRKAKRRQWWRDPSEIRYLPPGHISKRHAEGRVMRAIASDGFARWGTGLGLHVRDPLAGMTEEEKRAFAEEEGDVPPAGDWFEPVQADHDDYLTAMAWFSALGAGKDHRSETFTDLQQVLTLAAQPEAFSMRAIGETMGLKKRAAEQLYARATARIWEIANGFKTAEAEASAAALARVKETNRAARIGGSHGHDHT